MSIQSEIAAAAHMIDVARDSTVAWPRSQKRRVTKQKKTRCHGVLLDAHAFQSFQVEISRAHTAAALQEAWD